MLLVFLNIYQALPVLVCFIGMTVVQRSPEGSKGDVLYA